MRAAWNTWFVTRQSATTASAVFSIQMPMPLRPPTAVNVLPRTTELVKRPALRWRPAPFSPTRPPVSVTPLTAAAAASSVITRAPDAVFVKTTAPGFSSLPRMRSALPTTTSAVCS